MGKENLANQKNNFELNNRPQGKDRKHTGFWASFLDVSAWLNLVCLLGMLGVVIWSVEQAGWIKSSFSLMTVLLFSGFTGFILSRSRLAWLIAHLLSLAVGIIVVFWQGLSIMPEPDFISRFSHAVSDLAVWWEAAVFGQPSPVTIQIALMFGLLAWAIGYFSTWYFIRENNPWLALFWGTAAILGNLNFLSADKHFHFLYFIIAALVLLLVSNYTWLVSRTLKLTRRRIPGASPPVNHRSKSYRWGLNFWTLAFACLLVFAVYFSWTSPGFRVNAVADYARSNNPFKGDIELYWKNFFAPVPGKGSGPGLIHGGQQDIRFGGSLELSSQVVFLIKTDLKSYWKTQAYDFYESSGWKTGPVADKTFRPAPAAGSTYLSTDRLLDYTIIPQVNTNVLPVIGDLISSDITVLEKSLLPLTFTIDFQDPSKDSLLPEDIAAAARSIRSFRFTLIRNNSQIESRLEEDLTLVSVNRMGSTIQSITVSRDPPEDKTVIALSSLPSLKPHDEAELIVQMPDDVTPAELKNAGSQYPDSITDRYLQLPSSLPDRVKDLAADITRDALTPYAKVNALKEFLSDYEYSLIINAPPEDADGVDYFLFDHKSGYCTYFASAMTVMLRSVGVPARLVSGFLPGEYDAGNQRFIIRDRDYHAWTEYYSPGYGWVQVDATPSGNLPETVEEPAAVPEIVPETPETGAPLPVAAQSKNHAGLFVGIAAGIVLLALFFIWFRIFKNPGNHPAAYSRLVLLASLAGLGPRPWQTPLEFSHQLTDALPQQAPVINSIVQTYVISRYSPAPPSTPPDTSLAHLWPDLRRALLKRIFRIR